MPHGPLGTVDHRPDLRTVGHLRQRIDSRPHPFKGVSQGLPHAPAYLGQGLREFGVPLIAHGHIIALPQARCQGTLDLPWIPYSPDGIAGPGGGQEFRRSAHRTRGCG